MKNAYKEKLLKDMNDYSSKKLQLFEKRIKSRFEIKRKRDVY